MDLTIFGCDGRAVHCEVAFRAWLDQNRIVAKFVTAKLGILVVSSTSQRRGDL